MRVSSYTLANVQGLSSVEHHCCQRLLLHAHNNQVTSREPITGDAAAVLSILTLLGVHLLIPFVKQQQFLIFYLLNCQLSETKSQYKHFDALKITEQNYLKDLVKIIKLGFV